MEGAMQRWLVRRRLAAFGRRWDYDMGYAYDLLDADPEALRRFSAVMGISTYRSGLPADVWFAAKITATMAEDCGPCTQLIVRMAEATGIPAAVLRAVVARDFSAMPEPVVLGVRFTQAVLAHDIEADALRALILQRWGKRALASLGLAITSARLYPTLKYALGHGKACVRVRVAGTDQPVLRLAA
jgi:hypothetical protein